MPSIKTHIIQSALSTAALYPFVGSENAAAFGLSVVLVDIDHVVEYVRQTGSPKIWGVFPSCHIVANNLHKGFYVFNLCHTIEFMLLIAMLGLLHPVFFYVLAGALWHFIVDMFMLMKSKFTFMRALSVVEYIIRSSNPRYIVRLQDLLRIDAVIPRNDIWNYPAWIRHWQHCRPLC